MKSRIRLGLVQPKTYWGAEERRNLGEAIGYVESASRLGIDVLAFPENYPGPYRAEERYDVIEPMQAASAEHRVSLAFGTSMETVPGSERYHIATVLTNADGSIAGIYRRTHPRGPYIYAGGELWNFRYQEADEIEPIDMGWGKVGVVTCSEAFVPEVARLQALKGAEVCLFPTGIVIDELGYTDNWRTLVRARAIENLMYTAITVHLFTPDFADRYRQNNGPVAPSASGLTRGIAMVCSPERILAQTEAPGLLTADLDLDRIRYLREAREELIVPAPYETIPGVLSWRRPEILGELGDRPNRVPANASTSGPGPAEVPIGHESVEV